VQARRIAILTVLPVLLIGLLVGYNLKVTQPQGRYLFPALAALGPLFVRGLDEASSWLARLASQIALIRSPGSAASHGAIDRRAGLAMVVIVVAVAANLYALFAVAVPPYGTSAWSWLRPAP
jgi:hypothetical protein